MATSIKPVTGAGPTPIRGDTLSPVTDPILLLLAADATALLALAAACGFLPRSVAGFAMTGLTGAGALLCLPALLPHTARPGLDLPIGPPGLSLSLVLDPVSALFLFIIFLCGTAVTACWAVSQPRSSPSWINRPETGATRELRCVALCLAGLAILLLAGDAITLAIGAAVVGASNSQPDHIPPTSAAAPSDPPGAPAPERRQRATATWSFMPPLLLLISACLLTPSGSAPRFAAIRTAAVDPGRAAAAAALAVVAVMAFLPRDRPRRAWTFDALAAGAISPAATYLLLRLVIDLPGTAAPAWWGFALLLFGGTISVAQGWRAARHPDLDRAVAFLTRRQAGLAMIGLSLILIARSSDLPDAASFGLAAALLLAITSGVAGTLANLAAQALGREAGSWRLTRLGGLTHSMPVASLSLAASLLALAALPPGAGFAAMWLLFQSLLSAPRTGGLAYQLPLALTAAALALSSALATATSVRLIGIAVLGRPRSVRGSAARDVAAGLRQILLALSSISLLLGVFPGLVLMALANRVIRFVTGTGLEGHAGWATLSAYSASPGYSPLWITALLALALGPIVFVTGRIRGETRLVEVWNDGQGIPADMPFGDPQSQSAGGGFLPPMPASDWASIGPLSARLRQLRSTSRLSSRKLPSPRLGLWVILLALTGLLLVLVLLTGGGTPG
jgi:hydrogenase-4 component B